MSINPQTQSAFVTRVVTLPPEIRDAIYLEMWRLCGLRQHIMWHGERNKEHFCSWACTTKYEVDDGLQRKAEELRCRLVTPLGQNITRHGEGHEEVISLNRRLQSPWMNHYECGERASKKHGLKAVWGFSTSHTVCWRKNRVGKNKEHVPSWSPYLPMLLSCKLISEQCLKSIYESTTFIFTDMTALQMFFGQCWVHPINKTGITPPGFYKYARTLELSLSPDFPQSVICADQFLSIVRPRHQLYDFHWLWLDKFQNLHTLNIWISARANMMALDSGAHGHPYTGIIELNTDALEQVLSHLSRVTTVTLSTPLAPGVGPEEGYVEGVKARVYKRGDGDRFYPRLYDESYPDSIRYGTIHTSPTREVRLTRFGGTYLLMRKV